MEELDLIVSETSQAMDKSLAHFEEQLLHIRVGKASPVLLASLKVPYYGSTVPLSQAANVSAPDARTLNVQPWDKSLLTEIKKAIINADLGFNPIDNGSDIIINIPPLTEEGRKDVVKMARKEAENAKVNIRNLRKDANQRVRRAEASNDIKDNYEIDIQQLTDKHVKNIALLLDKKEKEIIHL